MDKNKIAKDITDEMWSVWSEAGNAFTKCPKGLQEVIKEAWIKIVLKHLAPIDSCQSLGGKTITPAKSEAARKNGAKGGRPKKPVL